jgi:hypothetical protein
VLPSTYHFERFSRWARRAHFSFQGVLLSGSF